MTRLKYGLIGYGLFGKHHAAAIAESPDSELVCIAVKSESSQSEARSDHPEVDVVGDYRELIARSEIDIVDVVVPNALHFQVGLAALESGKHLLMEKPMALETLQCEQLIGLAERQGRTIAVGHELRLSVLWAGVKQLIDQGAIGRVQHVLIELSRFPYRQGAEGWRYDIDRVGNWILEEPIHFFDLARWYLTASGEPVSVYARSNSRHVDHPELTDNFSSFINFADGAYAIVTQTLAAFGHHQSAKVTGTNGTIWARWSAADARSDEMMFDLRYGLGDDVTVVDFKQEAGELLELRREINAVSKAILENEDPPCTGNDGRWSTLLCLAAEQSARSGQIVPIS